MTLEPWHRVDASRTHQCTGFFKFYGQFIYNLDFFLCEMIIWKGVLIFFSPRSTWNNVSVNKYDSQKQTQNFVFWNCNNHNIEGEYTINRINSEGEKFLLIDLELYYNNMMITCISQHNKTLRILQFKLSEKLGHRWRSGNDHDHHPRDDNQNIKYNM